MSREIKFRAWTRQNPSMPWAQKFVAITGDGKQMVPIGGTFTGVWHALDDNDEGLIIEQYTGLKDKNGKEIYEGDIMRYDAIDYKVLWADYYAGFETKRLNSPWNNAGLTLHFLASVGRVIGNIHENKELLGGEDAAP